MLILNFSHPITTDQLAQIQNLLGKPISEVRDIVTHFDQQQPFQPQIEVLIEACGLTPQEWQTIPLLIIPPALGCSILPC